ncbi:MAG TPA: FemAB family XrtA/PEP-CTERM system-associated protein [Gemmatimonadaceae bacterium]|nr:FemAB family XrtA/PEP-CTERM system-associated protein [Gemmatimonadaceae bacterium]
MRVSTFTGDGGEWDTFVRRSPGWTHFHLAGWRSVIARVFGHECIYLAARDGAGALAGVLPLVRIRSMAFGHYLVSMPFLNYGGPLGSPEAVQALTSHASDLARDGGVKLLELRSRSELPITLPVSHRKITVLLDLPDDADVLWKRLSAKVRSQVRRPTKEGVTVRFGADQVAPFFDVFSHHMRDLGTPTQPQRLFQAIAEEFSDSVWFGCAYHEGRPVACGCAFRWGDEIEMTWASALVEYKRMAPNMLLYWSFMERAIDDGATLFNFGRCTPGEGTHRFKQQWGSRDEALWWYDLAAHEGTTTPSPTDSGYAWGPRLWKRLPLPVATALGPRIVRYIP